MEIRTKLRSRKDHFVATLYKEHRELLRCAIGDIMVFSVNNAELVRKIKKDYHISLPRILFSPDETDAHLNVQYCSPPAALLTRPQSMHKGKLVDIRHVIPLQTQFGHPLYVIPRTAEYSTVWYPVGGGVQQITIRHFVDEESLAEIIGLYFGDGSTSHGIRSFRLTNAEPSTLDSCLHFFETLGIPRDAWKAQLLYSTDKDLTPDIIARCKQFWSGALQLPVKNIVSIAKTKALSESLLYGSARIFIDNAVLVEVFLNGLLNTVLNDIMSRSIRTSRVFLQGFLRGLLAAEGSVILNKNGTVVKVGIAFDPHSAELALYKRILRKLGITYGKTHGNELLIYGAENMYLLHTLNAFRLHAARNRKFSHGIRNHRRLNPSVRTYPALSEPFPALSDDAQGMC